MAQPFSFGFASEDIEFDATEDMTRDDGGNSKHAEPNIRPIEPQLHTLDEMLLHLPSSIAYTTHPIPPTRQGTSALFLPRRELFDIRAQLMAEEDVSDPRSFPTTGLLSDDILSRVYEGGFKTWECAVDLARYLSGAIADGSISLHGGDVHVIELGAGTAVPTASLLQQLLHPPPSHHARPRIHITVADYNIHVLALATIPSLLLALTSLLPTSHPLPATGDLETSPAQLSRIRSSLSSLNIHISAISGAWGPAFVHLLRQSAPHSRDDDHSSPAQGDTPTTTLILASETIYSPDSIRAFAQTLMTLLEMRAGRAVALVAAKRVYFGVGGGVDEFVAVLEGIGGRARCVWDSSEGEGGRGVGRCILEVGLRSEG
ncbi:hypothetical protein MMC13_002962 [Lambiella insularis]|nr:hypothetical protein [Lambiella insularis]